MLLTLGVYFTLTLFSSYFCSVFLLLDNLKVEKKKKKTAEGACQPNPDRLVLTELLNGVDSFQTTARGMEEDGSFLEKELDRTRAMLDRTKLMLQLTEDRESASPRTIVDENLEKIKDRSSPPVKTLEVAEKAVKLQVEEAKKVEMELLEKVEAAKVDIDTGRKALEDALLKVKEASRNCGYDYGRFDMDIPRRKRSVKCSSSRKRRRRCIHKSTKFKNSSAMSSSSCASTTTTRMLLDGVGGGRKMVATTDTSSAILSIGQILRMKLIGSEEMEIKSDDEPEVSLREMLKTKI